MISTVDIILKKLAKNRNKQSSNYGHGSASDSDDDPRRKNSGDRVDQEIPTPATRTSKRQPAPKVSDSDDSASHRTLHQTIQKEQKARRPSIDSSQSQDWKETRHHVKNKSNKNYVDTNRKKKSKNVRTSTRSNKSKPSTKKGHKYVEDVQSDDEARGREHMDALSKRFKSVDMLHSAKDFDLESKSESESSLRIKKEEPADHNSQISKSDSQSDSSLRRRDEERKVKHKQLYLELKQRQEQERKEQLLQQKKLTQYERHRLESGGSLSPDSKRIVHALKLGETQAAMNSGVNHYSDDANYKTESRGSPAPNPKPWDKAEIDNRQIQATSVKHMVLENNPTGARSKHHVTTQAVIEQSIRQSERRNAPPKVPSKPNKKKDIQQEAHAFTTLPPVSTGNFQRGYRNGTQNQGSSVPPEVRGSYRPQPQQPPAPDAYRPATLSHSRRHDYNKPTSSAPYEANQQWHHEEYESRGYEQNHHYDHRLNQEIPLENPPYHPIEYEKYTPTYNAGSLPRQTHHTTHNRLVSDEVPFDPRYQSADLV